MRPHPTAPRSCLFAVQDMRLSVDMLRGAIPVAGELDRSSAHHLVDALNALRSSPSPVWTLDLQGMTFCDVEGLRTLHRAVALAHACGSSLHLTRIPPVLADLLALLAEDDAVPVPPPLPETAAV